MDALSALLPTLTRYANSAPRTTYLEPDDLRQTMALHLLELEKTDRQMNQAYRQRAAWLARSAALQREYTHVRHCPPQDDLEMVVDEELTPEEALLENERAAELAAMLPRLAAVIQTLNPTNQRIVKLILAGVGRGDLSRATGLSRSTISKRKVEIRKAFTRAGIHPL